MPKSFAPRVKSGSSPRSKISPALSATISALALSSQSILKQAERRLRVLDSHPDETLRLLYHSLTPANRAEVIGNLHSLNNSVGSLFVRFLRIAQSQNSSRTASSTSPSSG